MDIIGGPAPGAQTIHHCGMLNATPGHYTESPVTTEIVKHKLHQLGFLKATSSGNMHKADKRAVQAFQADQGIQVDGIVGPETAQRLAYATHPSANVHRCYRVASGTRN